MHDIQEMEFGRSYICTAFQNFVYEIVRLFLSIPWRISSLSYLADATDLFRFLAGCYPLCRGRLLSVTNNNLGIRLVLIQDKETKCPKMPISNKSDNFVVRNAELPKGFYPKFKLSTIIFYMEMAFFILISSCFQNYLFLLYTILQIEIPELIVNGTKA